MKSESRSVARWLKEHLWQIASLLLSAVAILLAYHRVSLTRESWGLQVLTESAGSLVNISPEAAADISVSYKGEPAGDISRVEISITNTGNQPLAEDDYHRPLSISFGAATEIADMAVLESTPPNVGMTLTRTKPYEAQASPALLNPDDSVTVAFIVIGASDDGNVGNFVVDGRIEHVSQIDVVDVETATINRFASLEPLSVLLLVLAANLSLIIIVASVLTFIWKSTRASEAELRQNSVEEVVRLVEEWQGALLSAGARATSPVRSEEPILEIIDATYGAADHYKSVAEFLKGQVSQGRLRIRAHHDNLGIPDPIVHTRKQLRIMYRLKLARDDGTVFRSPPTERTYDEGTMVSLP